jgi:Rrf2 family protein
MIKINKKVEYALILLKHLKTAPEGKLITAKELERIFGLSFDVVSKVMQTLSSHGYLKSIKGAHGGYTLERSTDDLTLYELNEMLLGPVAVADCIHHQGGNESSSCELSGGCNIVGPMNRLNEKIVEFYQSLTIAELLKETKKKSAEKKSLQELVSV